MADRTFVKEALKTSEADRAMAIMSKYTDKNFVQRILTPDKYPKIDLGNGMFATHKMAWGEADGKYYVFPTIQYENGKLIDYGNTPKAFDRAMQTGELIPFDNPKDAEWFSNGDNL